MNRFFKTLRTLGDDVSDFEMDDLLGLMGLTRRRSAIGMVLPAIGLVIAGGAIGAGIGLMFAPSSGRRMRQNVEDRVNHLRDKFKNTTNDMANNIGGMGNQSSMNQG